MDLKSLKLPFYESGITKYQCPSCGKGVLKIIQETFNHKETKNSTDCNSNESWEPVWTKYVYSCLFECTNTVCKDTVASTGNGSVDEHNGYDEDGRSDVHYVKYFLPEYFSPHLKFFSIPKDTPENVKAEINKSFSLIFADSASSANHIRVSLEHLLTHLKIKRFNINKKGKREVLSLHRRIGFLQKKYDHVKDIFRAVKWLGNAGSHGNDEVSLDDVLDSYELMNQLLIEIFDNKLVKANALAKKINKNKGPKNS